jgi:uncharacterized protein (TIGR02594 family)
MSKSSAAALAAAGEYLGLTEWPGSKHNPEVVEFFEEVGHGWVKDDETPWCAAFVGSVLGEIGIPGTGKLNARSYLDWGGPVNLPTPGDVVVFWRGSPSGWQGHVAFFVRWDGASHLIVRGGNQGNAVNDKRYPVNRVLGFRRYGGEAQTGNRPTLKKGAKGAFVTDLQDQLHELRYFHGKVDGNFGSITRAAVLEFQADNDLGTDGVVGPRTWAALEKAEPKPKRKVAAADLKADGSRTIKSAARADIFAGVGLGGVTIEAITDAAGKADTLAGTISGLIEQHGLKLIIAAAAVGAILYATQQIRAARVDDAQTGANLRR